MPRKSTSSKTTRTSTTTSTATPKAKTKAKAKAPTAAPKVEMTLSHDDIARKAYEIWQAKGQPAGQDEINWREAAEQLAKA